MRRLFWASGIAVLFAAAVGSSGSSTEAALIEYSAGHADIGFAYEDSTPYLHYHFGGSAVLDGILLGTDEEYDPEGVYVRVSDSLQNTFDTPPFTLDWIGLSDTPGATGPAWVLPQSNTSGVPFLGIATEEVPTGFGDVNFILEGFSGPGEFSVGQASFPPTIYWDSLSNSPDQLTLPEGTHDHFFYGFSAPGVYYVDLRAESVNDPNIFDTARFTFVVGDDTQPPGSNPNAVPEPGSFLLMGLGALGLGGALLRKRRREKQQAA